MTNSEKQMSREDVNLIVELARRACELAKTFGVKYTRLEAFMDLENVHKRVPLRLADLLAADDGNFAHDVFGIRHHLNRQTGRLEDSFLPRFADMEAR